MTCVKNPAEHRRRIILCAGVLILCALLPRAVVAEPWQPIARPLPPPGIAISDADRQQLESELAALAKRIEERRKSSTTRPLADLLSDVEIYAKAVQLALANTEFYSPQDVKVAHELLATATERLDQGAAGSQPWTTADGLVVRGYRSLVDGSVQPYGLVVPEGLRPDQHLPLYVWLHGRNDKLTDLAFIHERQHKPGQLRLADAIVLHPFGRSCLGWKSTAEIDVLEAIESVGKRYAIDPDRIVLMGFSMGGAGAWHMGAHYADHWAGVHAGAGFVDVARYQRLQPAEYPPLYEQKLWGLYDVPNYVRNLFNLPVVAYSGEIDKQKDAADFMAEIFQAQGRTLVHLVGPGMPHKYADASWKEVVERMQAAAAKGRDRQPRDVFLQTQTLRYNRMHWIEALGLDEHWRDARIDAHYSTPDSLEITTKNIRRLRLSPPSAIRTLAIDGQTVDVGQPPLQYIKATHRWAPIAGSADVVALRKSPGLQGPIDDAFMEPFLVVLPSGRSRQPNVQRWVDFEWAHFQRRWQAVYRGGLRVKLDTEVTDDDIAKFHLVAWGDPTSNAVISRIADELPIRWNVESLAAGPRIFAGASHVPLLIYPNPLNQTRYIVLNSGPTHREAHDRTNSLQNPKLPDWAIVDVTVAPDAERPGRVAAADFFDEAWQLRPASDSRPAAESPGKR